MLFVALSCLQGRPMARAFDELAALGTGIQLTPGNLPTPGFREHVARSGVPTRTHHGFAFDARRTEVWVGDTCAVASDSVHPPEGGRVPRVDGTVLEVMYPGYWLGCSADVDRAMRDELPLAVDISHVFIQRSQGVLDDATWRRLADYAHIAEVHVSANDGRHDTHQPLRDDTFGLAWARERLCDGTSVVLECYMHKLSAAARREQLELLRERR